MPETGKDLSGDDSLRDQIPAVAISVADNSPEDFDDSSDLDPDSQPLGSEDPDGVEADSPDEHTPALGEWAISGASAGAPSQDVEPEVPVEPGRHDLRHSGLVRRVFFRAKCSDFR